MDNHPAFFLRSLCYRSRDHFLADLVFEHTDMLSISQKAHILSKAGITVPQIPERRFSAERFVAPVDPALPATFEVDGGEQAATVAWQASVENLYTGYVAARAARSLREAQAAASLALLRNASWRVDA